MLTIVVHDLTPSLTQTIYWFVI